MVDAMGRLSTGEYARATEPFIGAAKVETYFKDFNRLREAIRRHDPEATEAAWDRCERWITAMTPDPKE